MQFILALLTVTAFLTSLVLLVVILLQEPKGGGLAAALGGSGMEAIGVNTGSVNKFTSWVATVWVLCCFLHAVLMGGGPSVTIDPTAGGDNAADTGGDGTGGGEALGGGGNEGDD